MKLFALLLTASISHAGLADGEFSGRTQLRDYQFSALFAFPPDSVTAVRLAASGQMSLRMGDTRLWRRTDDAGALIDLGHFAPLFSLPDGEWLGASPDSLRVGNGFRLLGGFGNPFHDPLILPNGEIAFLAEFASSAENTDYALRLCYMAPPFERAQESYFPDRVSLPLPMPDWQATDGRWMRLLPLADGSILLTNTRFTGSARAQALRVLPNGESADFLKFQLIGSITQACQLADGKLLLLGPFDLEGGRNLIRVDATGNLDQTWQSDDVIRARQITVQADGKILLAGRTSYFDPCVARLLPNGNPDATFQPPPHLPSYEQLLAPAPEGGLYLFDPLAAERFGHDDRYLGAPIVKLANTLPEERLTVSGNTVRWQRRGGATEINWANFDLWDAPTETWQPLGQATFLNGAWQLTAPVQLPTSGRIRARSRVHQYLVDVELEQTAFYGPAPLAAWKLAVLGDAQAPDLADSDGDGLPNLLNYALPRPNITLTKDTNEAIQIHFHRDARHFDVDLVVETSATPQGPWEAAAMSLSGGPFRGNVFIHESEVAEQPGVWHCIVGDFNSFGRAPGRYARLRAQLAP